MAGVPPPPAGCDEYFSLSNLAGSSYETEVGFSTLCVPNQVKAAVFILGLIFFFGLSGLSVLLMVKEFRRKNQWKWSWRTRGLVVYAVVPFCESFLVSPDHRPVVVSPADLYFPPSFLFNSLRHYQRHAFGGSSEQLQIPAVLPAAYSDFG